jgi:hypothetical protein
MVIELTVKELADMSMYYFDRLPEKLKDFCRDYGVASYSAYDLHCKGYRDDEIIEMGLRSIVLTAQEVWADTPLGVPPPGGISPVRSRPRKKLRRS